MGIFSKEQLQSFIKAYDIKNANAIHSALKNLFADTGLEFLKGELGTVSHTNLAQITLRVRVF